MFRSIIDAGTGWAIALGVIAAVNSVIAFFYYARPIRAMMFHEPADRRPHAARRAAAAHGRDRARRSPSSSSSASTRRSSPGSASSRSDAQPRVADVNAVAAQLAQLIHREGPIPFDRFMEIALYGEDGFFASGHGAGRGGARLRHEPRGRSAVRRVRARARSTGCGTRSTNPIRSSSSRPAPGNGRLAREVLRAAPDCLRALRYVLVERSAALRAEQRERLPLEPADEALGPFVRRGDEDAGGARARGRAGVHRARGAARARRVRCRGDRERAARQPAVRDRGVGRRALARGARRLRAPDEFDEVLVPDRRRPRLRGRARHARSDPAGHAASGGARAKASCGDGFVLVVDYATTIDELATRPWLRTYRAHTTRNRSARRARRAGHHRRRRARAARHREPVPRAVAPRPPGRVARARSASTTSSPRVAGSGRRAPTGRSRGARRPQPHRRGRRAHRSRPASARTGSCCSRRATPARRSRRTLHVGD